MRFFSLLSFLSLHLRFYSKTQKIQRHAVLPLLRNYLTPRIILMKYTKNKQYKCWGFSLQLFEEIKGRMREKALLLLHFMRHKVSDSISLERLKLYKCSNMGNWILSLMLLNNYSLIYTKVYPDLLEAFTSDLKNRMQKLYIRVVVLGRMYFPLRDIWSV